MSRSKLLRKQRSSLQPADVDSNETDDPYESEWTSWANRHPFLNVSVTPLECSIVCSKQLAQQYLAPTLKALFEKTNKSYGQASISDDDFVVISVEGEGLEAGQRVLELTSPLALAGISIFFITTYFSDYILVPSKSRSHVVRALEDRGFTFQKTSDVYVNPLAHHHRSKSLTQDEPASLVLERSSVGNFGNALLGSKDEFLVPITLDLGELPFEATGIVCGVAGRLCGGGAGSGDDEDDEGAVEGMDGNNKIEMSYLSTTRAGTVMVNEADLERAMGLLRVNGGG
ncbi:MAG: hypothetical protein Q9195_004321 [Heterodermia aff. obscurata]